MDVFEAIRTVLAVRSYQAKPVPDDVVHRIVESARLTARSRNGQPWHFIVVRDKERLRQLGALASSGPYVAQADFAIGVVLEPSVYGVSDASRAVQSMVLTAWEAGVGSNWVGFANLEAMKGLLSVPTAFELFALISFGYPDKRIGKGKKNRKALGEVAHAERYGTPFV
jgi:nitroreductase